VLVISHDEAYYEVADRVVRLRDGAAAEEADIEAEAGAGAGAPPSVLAGDAMP
jgi:ABC-type siderophore export system fused ATPase/permease subunit